MMDYKRLLHKYEGKTMRSQRNLFVTPRREHLQNYIVTTLGTGNLRSAVTLPPDTPKEEWLVVNTVDFFNQIRLLSGFIFELCTHQSCPRMTAGSKYEYLWQEPNSTSSTSSSPNNFNNNQNANTAFSPVVIQNNINKPVMLSYLSSSSPLQQQQLPVQQQLSHQLIGDSKPSRCPAPIYIQKTLDWIDQTLESPDIFPDDGTSFPLDFYEKIQTIFKRMFRFYAHVYHAHLKQLDSMGELAHFNTCFKHFILFVQEFKLLQPKDLQPLASLIYQMLNR